MPGDMGDGQGFNRHTDFGFDDGPPPHMIGMGGPPFRGRGRGGPPPWRGMRGNPPRVMTPQGQNYPQFMGGQGHGYAPVGMGPPGPGVYPNSGFPMFQPPWGMSPPGVPLPMFQITTEQIVAQIDPKIVAAAREWSEHTALGGKNYYFNMASNQSIWEKPPAIIDFESAKFAVHQRIVQQSQQQQQPPIQQQLPPQQQPPQLLAGVTKKQGTGMTTTEVGTAPGQPGKMKMEDGQDKDQPPKKKVKRMTIQLKPQASEPSVVTLSDDSDDESGNDSKASIILVDPAEAEAKAAKERALIPVEDRLKQFREMLLEKEVSAFSTWEEELRKIDFDSRYLLLNSKERKLAFDNYAKERAEEEGREKMNRLKQNKEQFLRFLKDVNIPSRMTYSKFTSKYGRDERCKLIEKQRDRETVFNEFITDLKKKEKEERALKKEMDRENFLAMLKVKVTDYHLKWPEMKKKLESDPRLLAVEPEDREDLFYSFQRKLRQEVRAVEKEKKRERWEKEREKARVKSLAVKKDGEDGETEGEKEENDKKEGEGSTEEKEGSQESPADLTEAVSDFEEGEILDDEDSEDEREERERKERVESSIRERVRQIHSSLAVHLRDRDKEREYHRHDKAIQEFQALLADVVRNVEITWKEARKAVKKDKRWSGVSILSRDEMEDLFTQHCDAITRKKKQRFQKMLAEQHVNLNSSWRDVRKKVMEDPRFEKFSTSDIECEREFELYLKELTTTIKNDYRELLKETKMLTYKTKVQLYENPGMGMVKDIEFMLSKDKRYLRMESMAEERDRLLLDFIEEMEPPLNLLEV